MKGMYLTIFMDMRKRGIPKGSNKERAVRRHKKKEQIKLNKGIGIWNMIKLSRVDH